MSSHWEKSHPNPRPEGEATGPDRLLLPQSMRHNHHKFISGSTVTGASIFLIRLPAFHPSIATASRKGWALRQPHAVTRRHGA
jgi:hypothetical protein